MKRRHPKQQIKCRAFKWKCRAFNMKMTYINRYKLNLYIHSYIITKFRNPGNVFHIISKFQFVNITYSPTIPMTFNHRQIYIFYVLANSVFSIFPISSQSFNSYLNHIAYFIAIIFWKCEGNLNLTRTLQEKMHRYKM